LRNVFTYVDNYKNGIDFAENQRSELSASESDSAEGDRNGALYDYNRKIDSDSAESDIAVTSSESDSCSVHSEFRSSLKKKVNQNQMLCQSLKLLAKKRPRIQIEKRLM
jgi:hypothetical protein